MSFFYVMNSLFVKVLCPMFLCDEESIRENYLLKIYYFVIKYNIIIKIMCFYIFFEFLL